MTVLIAGGGIAGLTLGLTLHQIGVPFRVFEAAREIRPMGVGINLQPNAVRELIDLGLESQLDHIGVKTRRLSFHCDLGRSIWEEPRGQWAGYTWPQYSVHRGTLQVMLHAELVGRAGIACIATGARAVGYEAGHDGAALLLEDGARAEGDLVVAADGIHSALRARMYPGEGDPVWNGRIMWRGTARARAWSGGGSMAIIGNGNQRIVAYPISDPDPNSGIATINWIAEKQFPMHTPWRKEDWNRTADIGDVLPLFKDWRFGWIDAPALIEGAGTVFEYPMVDRDPLPAWTRGRVSLIGDAAHPTYPVGSNGASQAIVDARVIGARMLDHGVTAAALDAYDAEVRPLATAVGLANRAGEGPDAILQCIEDLCSGEFDDIARLIPHAKLAAHSEHYKSITGLSITRVNRQPRTIPEGARVDR